MLRYYIVFGIIARFYNKFLLDLKTDKLKPIGPKGKIKDI